MANPTNTAAEILKLLFLLFCLCLLVSVVNPRVWNAITPELLHVPTREHDNG